VPRLPLSGVRIAVLTLLALGALALAACGDEDAEPAAEPVSAAEGDATRVVIDTEVGPVETIARGDGDRVEAVTIRWTPAFVLRPSETVKVDEAGEVPVAIAVGAGNLFAIVDAPAVGVTLRPPDVDAITRRGLAVRAAVSEQLQVEAPGGGLAAIENVLVHEPLTGGVSRNALVWGAGQVDMAPCGSGTCARMALFHHRGELAIGDSYTSEGPAGLAFTGRVAAETVVDGRRAVLPEITGSAYITGMSQIVFDPDDPLREGLPA
jgi:proline racemase